MNSKPILIAGPCSAESEEQVIETAKKLAEYDCVDYFRAGIWKPRTRPNSFEGIGTKGLAWLKKVKNEVGMKVTTEVANAGHVEDSLNHSLDMLWIGARTTVSPFAVQDIADSLKGVDIPVMVKNPINADLALWMGAIERLYGAGIKNITAIHRGFSTSEKLKYRNTPLWSIPLELKKNFPDIKIICDPSHIAGDKLLIEEVSKRAIELGLDGLMIESHINPSVALSDAGQQVTPSELFKIIENIFSSNIKKSNQEFDTVLNTLRRKIDILDNELIELLKMRFSVTADIGLAKKDFDVEAIQMDRFKKLLNNRKLSAKENGLSVKFIEDIFNSIHDESVKQQEILKNKDVA